MTEERPARREESEAATVRKNVQRSIDEWAEANATLSGILMLSVIGPAEAVVLPHAGQDVQPADGRSTYIGLVQNYRSTSPARALPLRDDLVKQSQDGRNQAPDEYILAVEQIIDALVTRGDTITDVRRRSIRKRSIVLNGLADENTLVGDMVRSSDDDASYEKFKTLNSRELSTCAFAAARAPFL